MERQPSEVVLMPRSALRTTSIGVVAIHTLAYYRRALRGVWRYAEARPSWDLTPIIPNWQAFTAEGDARPDGLIVTANTQELEKMLQSWRRPAVNISAVIFGQRFPRVGVDNAQVGTRQRGRGY